MSARGTCDPRCLCHQAFKPCLVFSETAIPHPHKLQAKKEDFLVLGGFFWFWGFFFWSGVRKVAGGQIQ